MTRSIRWRGLACLLLLTTGLASQAQSGHESSDYDDPPSRVAYPSDRHGEVGYSPSGEDSWIGLQRNRPLIRGDRLWTESNAHVELQIDSAAMRLGPNTGIEILGLDDGLAQIRLTEGTLNLRVRRLHRGQSFEIATPSLAFVVTRAGRYRIDVADRSPTVTIVVWEGAGEAYGERGSFPLRGGDAATFYDHDLYDYALSALPREDGFDRYCRERDARLARSDSLRYLDDDLAGFASLDGYGRWQRVSQYGDVWFPSQVRADWAPYRDGRWIWQEPWGWTWVDDAPWGFAPSHYGRWVTVSNRWGWIPGPRQVRPVYAPALVAFIGGRDWSVSISLDGRSNPIGWFPLGPREVYMPSYRASRDYFSRVNINNTVINNTVINNYYSGYARGDNRISQPSYMHRHRSGAITAVPNDVFVNARAVRTARIELDQRALSSGQIHRRAAVAPVQRSVLGGNEPISNPAQRGHFDRAVLARSAPSPRQRPIAERESQRQRNSGQPANAKPATSSEGRPAERAQRVRVVPITQTTTNLRATPSRRAPSKPAQVDARGQPEQTPARQAMPQAGQGRPRELNTASQAGRVAEEEARQQREAAAAAEQQRTQQNDARREREAGAEAGTQRQREAAAAEQQRARQNDARLQPETSPEADMQRQRESARSPEQERARQNEARRQRGSDVQVDRQGQREAGAAADGQRQSVEEAARERNTRTIDNDDPRIRSHTRAEREAAEAQAEQEDQSKEKEAKRGESNRKDRPPAY